MAVQQVITHGLLGCLHCSTDFTLNPRCRGMLSSVVLGQILNRDVADLTQLSSVFMKYFDMSGN